jgi:hypothetical protein
MTSLYKSEASISTSTTPENPSDSINPAVGMKKPGALRGGKKKKRYRGSKAIDSTTLLKDMVVEGDFVIVAAEDETYVGIVQYVMTEGMFGIASSDYSLEASMENPVVLVRMLELEGDEGIWEESEYLVGAEAKMVTKIEPLALEVETVQNDSEVGMAMFDAQMGKADDSMMPTETYQGNKQAPCWDGYVQRGMKDQNGQMVPNCVPVAKSDEVVEDLGSFAGIGKDYTKSTKEIYRVEE